MLTNSTNALLKVLGINPSSDDSEVTEEEIRLMIDLGSRKGAIKAGEKEILHNVFEFDNKAAGEAMTHRRDVVFLLQEQSDQEWERVIIENRHSNYPVCGEGPDDVTGILNTRDYLILRDRSRESVLAHAVRKPQFIPRSVRTDVLFRRMKKNRSHFAVILDEYGGMDGIVTMNDLLEELVGDLEDDSNLPPELPQIEKTDPGLWQVNGSASLDKVARETGLELPVDQYDTFAGFVFGLLGRIPEDGEKVELEAWGLKIKTMEIRDRRLEKTEIRLMENKTGDET